jgi:mono/diheme cytochrome c family protein
VSIKKPTLLDAGVHGMPRGRDAGCASACEDVMRHAPSTALCGEPLAWDRPALVPRVSAMRSLLVATLLVAATGGAAEPAPGLALYTERCSACHGDDGKGDGPMAAALAPKPRNFRDAAFWHERSVAQVRTAIEKGKPGTMMPPFAGVLTDAEIDALVRVVRGFGPVDSQ